MEYTIRKALPEDLPKLEEIYGGARRFMAENGNPIQWGTVHPPRQLLVEDIGRGVLYAVTSEDGIHGVFYFDLGEDPTYREIVQGCWSCDAPYGTIHRIAGDGSGGILKAAVEFAKTKTDYIRIDTHEDNAVMQKALGKLGFSRCGIIFIENGDERIAFDLMVK